MIYSNLKSIAHCGHSPCLPLTDAWGIHFAVIRSADVVSVTCVAFDIDNSHRGL